MSGAPALHKEPDPITACTIARDVQNFDLLIADMEAELGEGWGEVSFDEALPLLNQPDAKALEFIALAIDEEDEANFAEISAIIQEAKERGIKVIVIADDVSPITLHQLLKIGAEEFVPYPLPEGALGEAIERIRAPEPPKMPVLETPAELRPSGFNREGVVLPVHGLGGGTGASTFAVNLAWELATVTEDGAKKSKGFLGKKTVEKEEAPRVCILDFDLQTGSVSTYLDLPRREAVYELLSDTEAMDEESFLQALMTFNDKLFVLTAPAELLPLDLLTPEDIDRVVDMARANFDYVIIDMPKTVTHWTENVLTAAHVYFCTMELDMRCAQNALRFIRALKSEELPVNKLRYVLNRAPKFSDLNARGRVKRLAESLDIKIELQFPDGGRPVGQAGDHGLPLAESAPKNPLRKEYRQLAVSVHETAKSAATAS
ncbi:MAG TPA: pilus assembly protein CpaE [Aliiroseovarius sp.]|nr:pilus assembly protein CpaE [Aliiroseovarius sp.]